MSEQDLQGDASGTPTETASGSGAESKNDFVPRRVYEKTVGAEKNLRNSNRELTAKLAEFEAKEKAIQEQQMIEEKKFTEIIEEKNNLIVELEGTVNHQTKNMQDFQKASAVMGMLQEKGINLESKYMNLVPIEKIQLTEDGTVDVQTVNEVVSSFQKEHPRLVTPLGKLLPNDKSSSIQGQMSVDSWKTLMKSDPKAGQKALKDGRVKYEFPS